MKGEASMGFIFLPFCYFLYCVLNFVIVFYSCQGKGVWVYFSFKILLLYIFIKKIF
jgi:hypothetical protein